MKAPDIETIISLLDNPELLKTTIDELRSQAELTESIRGFILMYDDLNGDTVALKLQMEANKQHILKKSLVRRKTSKKVYLLPLAAALLIALGSLVYMQLNSPVTEFKTQFKDPGLPIYMSYGSENQLEKLIYHFRNEDYTSALRTVESAIDQGHTNDTLLYYRSLLYHLTEQHKNAIYSFRQFLQTERPFSDRARYFLALSLVKSGQNKQARYYFKYLCSSGDIQLSTFSCEHLAALKE
jgi:tetratricopeptide (TPR) repeat protein